MDEIDFEEQLESVLPLDEIGTADRPQPSSAASHALREPFARAASELLAALTGPLPAVPSRPPSAVAHAPRVDHAAHATPRGRVEPDGDLPAPSRGGGAIAYPRAALPARAQAGLDQIRSLLRLDDPLLRDDPRQGQGRETLLSRLEEAGHELLGEGRFRFHPAKPGEAVPPEEIALARDLLDEARARVDHVFYCPDARAVERWSDEARRRGARSVVMVAVGSHEGPALGVLEVVSSEPSRFTPEGLAMVALLADHCGAILDRAERIDRLVFVDPLTGAYNRSYFDLQMRNEIARAQRESASLALCIVDIDDFKAFNTAYGYQGGNDVLAGVAQTLRGDVRPFDTVARWGGEEFAVLLTPPAHEEDVRAVCERLRGAVQRLVVQLEGLDGRPVERSVTVSIGVALYPHDASSAAELWRAANRALLVAKAPPKNRVVFVADPRPQG